MQQAGFDLERHNKDWHFSKKFKLKYKNNNVFTYLQEKHFQWSEIEMQVLISWRNDSLNQPTNLNQNCAGCTPFTA